MTTACTKGTLYNLLVPKAGMRGVYIVLLCKRGLYGRGGQKLSIKSSIDFLVKRFTNFNLNQHTY